MEVKEEVLLSILFASFGVHPESLSMSMKNNYYGEKNYFTFFFSYSKSKHRLSDWQVDFTASLTMFGEFNDWRASQKPQSPKIR